MVASGFGTYEHTRLGCLAAAVWDAGMCVMWVRGLQDIRQD